MPKPSKQRPVPRESIPILDVGPYLRGDAGAWDTLVGQLRAAQEIVGFYYIVGHDIPWDLVDRTFDACARFHALPLEQKMAIEINRDHVGYVPMKTAIFKSSEVNQNTKVDLNEVLFIMRERTPDDPDVRAGKRFCGLNQWPANVPGFRDTFLEYFTVMEAFAWRLLPLYALALDLPEDYFQNNFGDANIASRISHYPPVAGEDNQFGFAPHTDVGYLTLLPISQIPGLKIRAPSGDWIAAPHISEAFLVNGGDALHRWTNGRFLSTPHRVTAPPVDRYAIPFFYNPNLDADITPLENRTSPGNPARFDPMTYAEYLEWYVTQNFPHQQEEAKASPNAAE